MYQEFALVYDRLMDLVDYSAWSSHYQQLLADHGVGPGAQVLEAACGTGSLSVHFAKHYQLTAGDVSQEMLSLAVAKAKTKGLNIPFLLQDMRKLRVHRLQDAIIAGCDAVNYLLTPQDLRRFLTSANKALKPSGVLAFDLSTLYKLQHILGDKPQIRQEEDICYLWENVWQTQGKKLYLNLVIFARQRENQWKRINEKQIQRAWTVPQLRKELQAHGFGQVFFYSEYSKALHRKKDQRMHVVAIKNDKCERGIL